VKPRRRARYVLLFGHSHEVSQMTKFHLRYYTQSVWRAKQQDISAIFALRVQCASDDRSSWNGVTQTQKRN
jgi:hypothetical protein